MVLVQEPSEVEFDAMPRNVIATGLVDFVLPTVRCWPHDRVTAKAIRGARFSLVLLDLVPADAAPTLLLIEQLRQRSATRTLPILVSCTDARLLAELAVLLDRLGCGTTIKPFDVAQQLGYQPAGQAGQRFEHGYI